MKTAPVRRPPVGARFKAWVSVHWRPLLVSGLLGLFVLGGKWFTVQRFAGETPYVDQWIAEGEDICLPLLEGQWSWARVLAPWNEHRIAPTRLLCAVLFAVTGRQWDPLVETAVAGLIHAGWLGAIAFWLMRRTPDFLHPWICGFLAAAGVLPFAFENTLWGFQSQFYFLLIFSTLAGWGLLGARVGSGRWWLGGLAAVLAVLSMGSGGLAGGAVLVVLGFRALRPERGAFPFEWITALVATAFLVAAWALRVDAPAHTRLVAGSWMGFSLAFWRLIAWPYSGTAVMAVIVWLPFGFFVARLLLRHLPRGGGMVEATLFMGVLALAQVMALALMRSTLLAFFPPTSRYQDLLVVGLGANFMALLVLVSQDWGGRWLRSMGAVWAFVVAAGLIHLAAGAAVDSLGPRRPIMDALRDQLALFLRVGDEAALKEAERYDPLSGHIKAWTAPARAAALPPALQARPPAGFGFAARPDWMEGGFDPKAGPPGGYAVWGNWQLERKGTEQTEIISEPFVHTRGAVALSYAMSSHWGDCTVEFLTPEGNRAAVFTAFHAAGEGGLRWREANLLLRPGRYQLRIRDERAIGHFGVTAPREMSVAGFMVRLWLKHSAWLLLLAGGGLVAVFTWSVHPQPGKK